DDARGIWLTPLRDVARLPRTASIKLALQITLVQGNAGRATVDDAPYGRAMALAKAGDGERSTPGISAHECCSPLSSLACGCACCQATQAARSSASRMPTPMPPRCNSTQVTGNSGYSRSSA